MFFFVWFLSRVCMCVSWRLCMIWPKVFLKKKSVFLLLFSAKGFVLCEFFFILFLFLQTRLCLVLTSQSVCGFAFYDFSFVLFCFLFFWKHECNLLSNYCQTQTLHYIFLFWNFCLFVCLFFLNCFFSFFLKKIKILLTFYPFYLMYV